MPNAALEPLRLAGTEPFGVGGRRLCFVHPLDRFKCVKVLRQDERRTVRVKKKGRLVPAALRREYDNNADEMVALEQLQRRLGDAMGRHLPRCHGIVPTDIGSGLVLDLMRDADGGISRTIRELVTQGTELSTLRPAFDVFGNFFIEHRVVTRQLLDHNIVARHEADGGWTLFLIDGLGDPSWLPLARWIPALAESKIRRNVAAAWERFERFAASGGVTDVMRKNSTWGQGMLNHRGL
jgi:hypothetical protein